MSKIYDMRIHEVVQQLKMLQVQRDKLAKQGKLPFIGLESEWKAKRLELIGLVAEYEK